MKKILLVSDLHLDETESNAYRWDIFGQIEGKLYDHKINSLYILGDVTDKKDRHASRLVNKLMDQLQFLEDKFDELIILAGNHDYVDQDLPYLAFYPKMFYGKPFETRGDTHKDKLSAPTFLKELFLPHVRNPAEAYGKIRTGEFDIIFTHLDVKGTTLDNGMKSLEGLPLSFFGGVLTFSGHIHVGQRIGRNFHYIGSPYSIIYERLENLHRGIILTYQDDGEINWEDTYFEFPRKRTIVINNVEEIPELNEFDKYKFDVKLKNTELDKYNEIKKKAGDSVKLNLTVEVESTDKVKVKSCTNYFVQYCKEHELNQKLIKAAKEIMNENI